MKHQSKHRHVLAVLVVTAAAAAQSYTVSPSPVGTGEGNNNNMFPWTFATGRYQQIHGDLRGTVRNITALSLRRDGELGAFPSATARTLDAEYFMADSDFALASATFATNYASVPVKVVARKTINLPDWTAAAPQPAPWSFTVPLDTPFVHTGVKDLVWEVAIYSTTATGSYPADAYSAPLSNDGPSVSTGPTTGCLATGRVAPMSLYALQSTSWTAQTMSLTYYGSLAPVSAPSAFLLGLASPNLPLPGLCANVYVDKVFLTINTTASPTGSFSSGSITVPYQPALAGLQVYAQGAAADVGQTAGIPVALTNGLKTTFAAMPPGPSTGDKLARIYSNVAPAAASGYLGLYYGLVCRFTH